MIRRPNRADIGTHVRDRQLANVTVLARYVKGDGFVRSPDLDWQTGNRAGSRARYLLMRNLQRPRRAVANRRPGSIALLMFLRNWTPRKLILSWLAYWAGLIVVAGWRPLWQYWQIQRSNGRGTVSASYSGGLLSLALWVAGPPLLLFIAWFFARSRARAEQSKEASR